ncbi:MAG: hypothetical protein ACK5L7_11310 [Paludibacteraceae bacterium]
MYLPQEMEPHKPMYVTLKRVNSLADRDNGKLAANADFCVYPNLAKYSMNMRFILPNEPDVRILIYSANEQMFYDNHLGKYTAGKHDISIDATFKEGCLCRQIDYTGEGISNFADECHSHYIKKRENIFNYCCISQNTIDSHLDLT